MLPGPLSNPDVFRLNKKKWERKYLGYLCPVMFCLNPFSGFREEVENGERI